MDVIKDKELWAWDPLGETNLLRELKIKVNPIHDIRGAVTRGNSRSLSDICWEYFQIVTEPIRHCIYPSLVGIAKIYRNNYGMEGSLKGKVPQKTRTKE